MFEVYKDAAKSSPGNTASHRASLIFRHKAPVFAVRGAERPHKCLEVCHQKRAGWKLTLSLEPGFELALVPSALARPGAAVPDLARFPNVVEAQNSAIPTHSGPGFCTRYLRTARGLTRGGAAVPLYGRIGRD